MILKLGAWKSLISGFGALDEVPGQHRATWAWAWGEVLRRVLQAEEESEELDCALMWLLFLPQALLRKPVGRGGSRGRGFVNRRFNALAQGQWGEVVRLWEVDLKKFEERGFAQRAMGADELDGKIKREVLKLLAWKPTNWTEYRNGITEHHAQNPQR